MFGLANARHVKTIQPQFENYKVLDRSGRLLNQPTGPVEIYEVTNYDSEGGLGRYTWKDTVRVWKDREGREHFWLDEDRRYE